MKRLLTVFLVLTLVISAFTAIPVSAVETDVAKGKIATGWYNNGTITFTDSNFITGYDPSKMTDGNDNTFVLAKVEGNSGHMLVIDLGQEYDITKIRIKAASTDEAKAVQTANGQTGTAVNSSACLFAADKVPEYSDFNGANIADGVADVVKVNAESSNISGKDTTYTKVGNISSGDAIGKHRYVGVFAPFSYGFAVNSLEVYADVTNTPPTTITVNKDVAKDKTATGWYNSGSTAYTESDFISGYESSKMTDGNDDTFVLAKVEGKSGHMLVIDLGQEYDITKIRIKAASTDEAKAVQTANGQTETAVNSSACLFAADKVPEYSDFNGANIADGVADVVKVNVESSNISGKDKTYTSIVTSGYAIGKHRYVGVFAPFSYGFAVNSLEVWADVESDIPTAVVNKDVAKDKTATGWYNSGSTAYTESDFISGYESSKMTDGDDDTFVLAKVEGKSGHMLVIDLGQEYDITKIRIKAVTKQEANQVQTDNSMTPTSVNTSACLFAADKMPEYSDFNGINIADGVTDVVRINVEAGDIGGLDRTYTKVGNISSGDAIGKHRYVGVFAPYSYGFAVSSLEVWADAVVPVEERLVSRNKAVFSSGDRIGNDDANAERNIVDGRTETVFAGIAYSSDYFGDDAETAANFVSDFDIVIDLGISMPISKIIFNPYNVDESAADVVYTIGGTNDYGVTAGMSEPEITKFADYTGPADNVALTKEDLSGSFRFIVVNVKNSGSLSSVIAGIRDMDVYGLTASEDEANADTRMRRVSRGITPIISGTYRFGDGSKITDGSYSLGYGAILATSGVKNCLVLDLGKEYPISAVDLMQIKNNSGFDNTQGVEIIATNTAITEDNILTADYDVLVSGAYFSDRTIQKLMYLPVSSSKTYRYIGVRGCSGMYMPFREFDVYTSEISTEPVIGILNYSIDNTDVNFEIYADNIEEAKDYLAVVACYDENGILTNIDTANEVSFAIGQNKLHGKFENVVMPDSAKVKVYVVDSMASLAPITVCVGK